MQVTSNEFNICRINQCQAKPPKPFSQSSSVLSWAQSLVQHGMHLHQSTAVAC